VQDPSGKICVINWKDINIVEVIQGLGTFFCFNFDHTLRVCKNCTLLKEKVQNFVIKILSISYLVFLQQLFFSITYYKLDYIINFIYQLDDSNVAKIKQL
jgi:hypothetical protein